MTKPACGCDSEMYADEQLYGATLDYMRGTLSLEMLLPSVNPHRPDETRLAMWRALLYNVAFDSTQVLSRATRIVAVSKLSDAHACTWRTAVHVAHTRGDGWALLALLSIHGTPAISQQYVPHNSAHDFEPRAVLVEVLSEPPAGCRSVNDHLLILRTAVRHPDFDRNAPISTAAKAPHATEVLAKHHMAEWRRARTEQRLHNEAAAALAGMSKEPERDADGAWRKSTCRCWSWKRSTYRCKCKVN